MLFAQTLVDKALALAGPFVRHWEDFQPKPYLCPTGHWTIGFGCTHHKDGTAVGPNDPEISIPDAVDLSNFFLSQTINHIEAELTVIPTAHELAAMTSCAYNIGLYGFDKSTILKQFDLHDVEGSSQAFLLWDKGRDAAGNLHVITGLRNRRLAERLLFLTQDVN